MRLLNVKTMKLEEYFGNDIPDYAILSHCWGTEEVTFQDIHGTQWHEIVGAKKIKYAAVHAREDSFRYVWIDTCCIDKSSSAELSEAINSMYQWYADSKVCYAYLEDVTFSKDGGLPSTIDDLRESRWFTRGWTLQELIAPSRVLFFDSNWKLITSKAQISPLLSTRTGIPESILRDPSKLRTASVAKKMSWAAGRRTTRIEDRAYCLLGMFQVNMPLLYGEGQRGFIRLQEEILKESVDQSLFAWGFATDGYSWGQSEGILAESPDAFQGSGNVIPIPTKADRQPYVMTNKGLRIELPLLVCIIQSSLGEYQHRPYPVAMLDCQLENDFSGTLGMPLKETADESLFLRDIAHGVSKFSTSISRESKLRTIYIAKTLDSISIAKEPPPLIYLVRSDSMRFNGYHLTHHGTPGTIHCSSDNSLCWHHESGVLKNTIVPNNQMQVLLWKNYMERKGLTWFIFQSLQCNECFIVVVGIIKSAVKIIAKPKVLSLDKWLAALLLHKEDYQRTGSTLSYTLRVPEDADLAGSQREVFAKLSVEEVLNRKGMVLEVGLRKEKGTDNA